MFHVETCVTLTIGVVCGQEKSSQSENLAFPAGYSSLNFLINVDVRAKEWMVHCRCFFSNILTSWSATEGQCSTGSSCPVPSFEISQTGYI
jgi:hypothetical protein